MAVYNVINKAFFIGILSVSFIGCAQKNTMYYWDGEYQQSLYSYLKNESDYSSEIEKLEKSEKIAEGINKKMPPGFYAHLALLYENVGNYEKAKVNFNKEIENFPESKDFINFLTDKKFKKQKDKK